MFKQFHFKNISLDENLNFWIEPIVKQRTLGFKSHADFFTQAARELLKKYVELGMHPWSKNFPLELVRKENFVQQEFTNKNHLPLPRWVKFFKIVPKQIENIDSNKPIEA